MFEKDDISRIVDSAYLGWSTGMGGDPMTHEEAKDFLSEVIFQVLNSLYFKDAVEGIVVEKISG